MSDAPPAAAAYPGECAAAAAAAGYTCLSANQQNMWTAAADKTQGMGPPAAAELQNPLVKHGLLIMHGGYGGPAEHIFPENSSILVNGSEGKVQNVLCIDDVKIGKKIGEGSFGEVYQAFWHGNVVAAKKTKRCDISNDLLSEYSVKNYTHNKLILLLSLIIIIAVIIIFYYYSRCTSA